MLGGEIYLHVSSLTSKTLQNFWFGSAEDVVDSINLIELVFPREEWFLGDEFK